MPLMEKIPHGAPDASPGTPHRPRLEWILSIGCALLLLAWMAAAGERLPAPLSPTMDEPAPVSGGVGGGGGPGPPPPPPPRGGEPPPFQRWAERMERRRLQAIHREPLLHAEMGGVAALPAWAQASGPAGAGRAEL